MSIDQMELPLETRGIAPTPLRSGEAKPAADGDGRSGLTTLLLMEQIVEGGNLQRALKRVRQNKGSPGGDGRTVDDLTDDPGALLFTGDGHALLADVEPTGAGLETSMDVEFSVEIRKNARLTNPRVENAEYVIAMGSQREFVRTLDYALKVPKRHLPTPRWAAGIYCPVVLATTNADAS